MAPLNVYADVGNGATGLRFGLSFLLQPYFVNASSESSIESAHLFKNMILTKSHVLAF